MNTCQATGSAGCCNVQQTGTKPCIFIESFNVDSHGFFSRKRAMQAPIDEPPSTAAAPRADSKVKRKRDEEVDEQIVAQKHKTDAGINSELRDIEHAAVPAAAVPKAKRIREEPLTSPAPAKLSKRKGGDHASGTLAQPPLMTTIEKLLAKRGTLSLAKLVKLVRKKHWDAESAAAADVLEQVRAAYCICVECTLTDSR